MGAVSHDCPLPAGKASHSLGPCPGAVRGDGDVAEEDRLGGRGGQQLGHGRRHRHRALRLRAVGRPQAGHA
eukprot:5892989-Pyramimonas_sp.AAC.1